MKKPFKITKYKVIVLIVIILGIFLRVYRLPNLTSFSYEQALALEASGKMVQTKKISLIGIEYFIRQTSDNHSFFNSAAYLYPLSITQLLFGFDPIYPAYLFVFLNILAGVGMYLFTDKYFKKPTSLTVLVLFMFSPSMIEISRTVWHVYLLVPITVLSIWSYAKYFKSLNAKWLTLLGLSLGLGFGIHISYILSLLFFFLATIYLLYKKHKLVHLIPFFVGVGIGYSPLILFDLRHNFYNLSTMLTFLAETFTKNNSSFAFSYYHFLYFLVPLYLLLAIILNKIFSFKLLILILMLYITISFPKWNLFDEYPPGMPKGTNLTIMKEISAIIKNDVHGEFEVASIVDGETRAENLRYLLEFIDRKKPMDSNKYPEASVIYVISYSDQDPLTKSVWELNSIKPAKIIDSWKVNDLVTLDKIQKL